MLPQSGHGFIWSFCETCRENRREATIFVPDSKRLFLVSISTKEIKKEDIIATRWVKWGSVGVRDALKPTPLNDAKIMDGTNEFLKPEYSNETFFRSIVLFPDREDLVRFVGKNNGWSPHVGIVEGDEDDEVTRGAYAVALIQRSDTADSSFALKKGSLKFPDGFVSKRDQKDFEGLTRQIELAAEEAAILASKGRAPVEETRFIPPQPKVDNTGGFDHFVPESSRVIRTDLSKPGWSKGKSEKDVEQIKAHSRFAKENRFHQFIVYKCREGGPGFVGFTPLIGSVHILSHSHKTKDQNVKIGDTIDTRVEYNKHSREFVIESIVDIKKEPMFPFDIEQRDRRIELLIQCLNLNLKDYEPLSQMYEKRKVGVINHPTLSKILVFEDEMMNPKWKEQEVTAILRHYEGIEKRTPLSIRLVLKTIERLFDDGSNESVLVDLPTGRPDEVDSDVDDEDENEDDEGSEKYSKRSNENEMEPESAFNSFKQYDRDTGAFSTYTLSNQRDEKKDLFSGGGFEGDNGGFGSFDNGGFGGNEGRRGGKYRGNGRGGDGGGRGYDRGGYDGNERGNGLYRGNNRGGGGRSNDERHSSYSYGGSSNVPMEGHGFGMMTEKSTTVMMAGILVSRSRKSSVFYTLRHKLVEYEGDTRLDGFELGVSAEFAVEPNRPPFAYRAGRGTLQQIDDLIPYEKEVYNDELFIRVKAYLTPCRDIFECDPLSDVLLKPHQTDLKLHHGGFVEKSRIQIGHSYDIWVKFCTNEIKWVFDCIEDKAPSFVLEEIDEIEIAKKMAKNEEKEMNESRKKSNRNGDYGWERSDNGDEYSMRSGHTLQSKSSISRREEEYYNEDSELDTRFSAPSRSSKTPSFVSESTQLTKTSTVNNNKELLRELKRVQGMLKRVWAYQPVQKIVKQHEYFVYENVDEYLTNLAEDASEMDQ